MSAAVTDPKFIAAVDMIRRTGARTFQCRYQDDEPPTVWVAIAEHVHGPDGIPVPAPQHGKQTWSVAAGLHPVTAVLRLCEQLIDGGICAHCNKGTAFDTGFTDNFLDEIFCWTQWDPELATFRRSCEGATP